MLIAIMLGVIVITYFIADIQRQTQIETLAVQHKTEIQDITYQTENFTDYFLQGTVKLDSAREIREIGNYHFDFALFWFTNALKNTTESLVQQCIDNCTSAMGFYLDSYQKFAESKPYFETATGYTERDKYIEILGYYGAFAQSGKNITLLRYNASQYLKYAVENLSLGQTENVSMLMELFNETEELYTSELGGYDELKDQIDGYLFFNEIREED